MKLCRWGGVVIAALFSFAVHSTAATPGDDQKVVAALDTQYQAAVKANDASTMDRILADSLPLPKKGKKAEK